MNDLEEKCNKRFDEMMNAGAKEEVAALLDRKLPVNLPVMKAIGVSELTDCIMGKVSEEEAVRLCKLHTRQYAKRQLTWFKNRLVKMCEKTVVLGCEQNN